MTDYVGELPGEIINLDGIWFIQGKQVGSSYEVNYALALSNAGWEYEYLAGWWIHGKKLEIDFRVFGIPRVWFVFIDGAVWHDGDESQQDRWERLQLFTQTKDFANFPITVTNPDCDTYDHAWAHVNRTFGRR